MLHYVIYTVLVLLYQLADCKPVDKMEETLDNLFNSIKNETCSLDITASVDDKKFVELCGDKIVPNLTNISDDQFLFDFQSYLCYSVYHNVRVLCDSGHNQTSFTPQHFQTEPSKFCSSIPEINITDKCNTWLKGTGDMGTEDCSTVTKVIAAIMKDTDDLCSKECIKADKLDPICKSLVGTSLILASVNNNIVSPKETLPPATQEKTDDKSEKPESTTDSDDTSVKNIDTPKVPKNVTATIAKEKQQEMDTPEIPENEAVTKTKEEKQETEAAAAAAEHETQSLQENTLDKNEINKMSSTAEEQKEEEEVVEEVEEDEGHNEIVPSSSADEDFVTEPLPTVTQNEETEEALSSSNFQGSIKMESEIGEESSFFSYFMMLSVVSIVGYLVFHNKQKVLHYYS